MKFSIPSILLIPFVIFFTLALSTPVLPARDTDADEMYLPIADLHISGTVDGVFFNKSGTAQDIYAQLAAEGHVLSLSSNVSTPILVSKSKVFPALCCPVAGQNWKGAYADRTLDNIKYLNALGSRGCTITAKHCSKIACSYKSAIWACNDQPYDIAPSCSYLGSYAKDIYACGNFESDGICGQEFDTDGYNVIVRSSSC